MDSSQSVRQRFLEFYFQKFLDVDAAFRRGQDDMIQALARLDDDLAQIVQAKSWITQWVAESNEFVPAGLVYTEIDSKMLRLCLSNNERITWYNDTLNIARQVNDAPAIMLCLFRLYNVYGDSGRYEQARAYLEELRSLAQVTGAKRDEAKAWVGLGAIAYHQANQTGAQYGYERAVALLDEIGDQSDVWGIAHRGLASVYSAQGLHDLSLKSAQNTVTFFRQTKDLFELCTALNNLGSEYKTLERYAEASAALEECQQLCKQIGDNGTLGYVLANLGLVKLVMGQPDQAQAFIEESLVLLQVDGDTFGFIAISSFLHHITLAADNLEASYAQLCDLIGQALEAKMIGNVLSLLANIAKWYLLAGQPEQSIALLNFVAARPELDSEWLPFLDEIRSELSAAGPDLQMDLVLNKSLEDTVAEVLATTPQKISDSTRG